MAPPYLTADVFCAGCAAKARHERKDGDAKRPDGVHTGFLPNPHAATLDDEEGPPGHV